MDSRTKSVGKIIFDRRTALSLTQKDVADYVGVSEATVSRWESGHIDNMRRDRIAKLAKVLQISPLVIMGVDEPAPPAPQKSDGLPELNARDERDIERDLEDMLHSVAQADYKAPGDEEDTEALRAALRVAMIQAKRTAKKKYTPRKYRKDK
ncbi:helix-turn-helix domain-containing protein [Selenomonas bovis]|uniref:helix-turn-helix domain-containing protein n=1 Tax=Selenomonas bovis TaxID=416586 RepID=UPI00035C0F9D|nr:helix-turn-helix domain-containing protein [Selenomonas bovis]